MTLQERELGFKKDLEAICQKWGLLLEAKLQGKISGNLGTMEAIIALSADPAWQGIQIPGGVVTEPEAEKETIADRRDNRRERKNGVKQQEPEA